MQALRGSELDGRYRLLEPVGRGGMATVWRGRDLRLGRDVAVKLIAESRLSDPTFVERFEREAQIAARLSHPNLVGVHDLRIDAGQPYLVMEFVEGETLEQRLERAPETIDAVVLARTMLDVLAAIHDEGIVHRDLKPSNVMYQDDGRIRLTDFGIARIIGSSSITETGHVIGTLEYMAPEVRSGEAPSPSADLYALGVMLAKCGATRGPLADLVRRLRAADPAKRPESARLAQVSIAGLRSDPSPSTEPTEPATEVAEVEPAATPPREPVDVLPRTRSAPPSPPERRESHRSGVPAPALIGAALAAVAAVVLLVTLIGGAGDEQGTPVGNGGSTQASGNSSEQQTREPEQATTAPEETPVEPTAPVTDDTESVAVAGDPETGLALNNKGYAMLEAGDAEGAVPILEDAVASWPEGTDDINYQYALYNLGWALTDAGRPEEAIPILEERLQFPNQRAVVRAKLDEARAAAG
jgi:eukaryotic-like serine/threonine-protein kinase